MTEQLKQKICDLAEVVESTLQAMSGLGECLRGDGIQWERRDQILEELKQTHSESRAKLQEIKAFETEVKEAS